MKLAAADFAVWLIIAIIVGIGKLWTKFATSQPDDDQRAPPPVRPRPRPQPLSSRRAVERNVPPAVKPVTGPTWEAAPKDLREFLERLTRPAQPQPVTPPPPLPLPAKPPPAPKPAASAPAPVAAKASVPEPASRAARWTEALRDPQNLRNIIISAEIIGPPRGA